MCVCDRIFKRDQFQKKERSEFNNSDALCVREEQVSLIKRESNSVNSLSTPHHPDFKPSTLDFFCNQQIQQIEALWVNAKHLEIESTSLAKQIS